ncbi:MAG: beta-ketoacyl-ACP synthase II [Acuticoccus sp.]
MQDHDPIVVTGMGAVSPLGVGVAANWRRLVAGESGIVRNTRFDVSDFACKIAGLVPSRADDPEGFAAEDFLDPREMRKSDLFIHYAVAATQEAIAEARWAPADAAGCARTAVVIATGVGGIAAMTDAVGTLATRGPRRLSPFVVPSFLPNLAAGHISIRHGFTGPIGCPVTACAASAQAIGDGMRLIASGEADVAVCGGADACVGPVSIGGFGAARALSTAFNDRPAEASRPFDTAHDGFVLSEGAATLVIERLSHALRRGAEPLAVVAGYGTAADAYHITAGRPDGAGGAAAMTAALAMAGIGPDAVDYVNAHSTSTPVGDAAEVAALRTVFPQRGSDLPVTSTKASTGHLLGAAGALEAIYSVLALRNGVVPAGRNIADPEPDAATFDLVREGPLTRALGVVVSNGFGFGGVNASLAFAQARPAAWA